MIIPGSRSPPEECITLDAVRFNVVDGETMAEAESKNSWVTSSLEHYPKHW